MIMIAIIHQWGADYLVFDEPIAITPQPLTSPQGITITPGQRLCQLGKKRRSSFSLKTGMYMTYEGTLQINRLSYAIFHCPWHDEPQQVLFGQQKQYRYAFACVWVKNRFQCFLRGKGGPDGMGDIQLDFVA